MNTNTIAYMCRLKPGVDDSLITFLDGYRRANRTNEVLRAALTMYAATVAGRSVALSPAMHVAPTPAPAMIAPPQPPPSGGEDVVNKARKAFFK